MGCGSIKAWMDTDPDSKTWFFLGVLTAVAIQAQRLPLPPRVRTAALALGKPNSSPQSSFLSKTHRYTITRII
jgi:hypothetical protein